MAKRDSSTAATWSTNDWMARPQRGGQSLQGGGAGISLQGSSPKLQAKPRNIQGSSPKLQVTTNPYGYASRTGGGGQVLGVNTTAAGVEGGGGVDPAAAKAAADAAKAAALRGEITSIIGSIKNIFNSRYGQAKELAQEQRGTLNQRFANESQDLTRQIGAENEAIGASSAAAGTFDSSYRGNNVDTVTREGEGQIRKLGEEMDDSLASIGGWLSQQATSTDAQKKGLDLVIKRLAESTDPDELSQVRNSLESRITELKAQGSDNQTKKQSRQALEKIAPSSARSVKLQTTLSQILKGNADAGLKKSIGSRLITNSGISGDEAKKIMSDFTSQLEDENKPQ